ncbi:MAG: phenylalanine--tRNA ligase subunit alpha [Clostridiales bacterium]|nr:phenylalanine--tRNA ligase subunit alpha [Clostridiales bacterium]
MFEQLAILQKEALARIEECADTEALQELKVAYLGKKGSITQISRSMGALDAAERPRLGQAVNTAKDVLEAALSAALRRIKEAELAQKMARERDDITLPGAAFALGHSHILSQVTRQIEDIFLGMGYTVAEGPEVELDYYNFEAMNIPPEHPARDMQDSFYFSESILLRTHTSPTQAHVMEAMRPAIPVKVICPGKVYRRDDDATHSPMFHQVEGLYIDTKVTLADLKGTLLAFAQRMFGEKRQIRLRPSYFPFTEPSAEVDISCFVCGGAGCRLCKGSGWIEILGSGMVHPNVLSMSGYDPQQVSGFAFGMGADRIAMLKYGINDMRLLFDNDLRFLAQF